MYEEKSSEGDDGCGSPASDSGILPSTGISSESSEKNLSSWSDGSGERGSFYSDGGRDGGVRPDFCLWTASLVGC